MNQIELHNKIDELLAKGPSESKREDISVLVSTNQDTQRYFFTKADEHWLSWLLGNGFLDVIKQKAEDSTRYGYKTPELNYLVRMAEKRPKEVTDIILAVPISRETFNPEVIDQFLRICSGLPAEQLARMAPKILKENWVSLMNVFNQWGFEYEKMFQTLANAKDYESILMLAEAVLVVRAEEKVKQVPPILPSDNPFYFSDLSYTKVFEYLLGVDKKNIEKVLSLATHTMKQIILLSKENEEKEKVFKVYDKFFLLDVDFFTLGLEEKNKLSHRDDVKNLAAVIKQCAEQTIGRACDNKKLAHNLYAKYFELLPDCRSMWRLRLFVMSLCPEVFKEKLKESFFRLFDVERYYNELISGTEYLKTLRKGFPVLSDTDKREYVKRVVEYFLKKDREKKNEKENWHIGYGSRILSVIADQLTESERQTAKEAGFTLDPNYEPESSIGEMHGGFIKPRPAISQEEFSGLPIAEISKKLRTDWKPEALQKQNTGDDFLNPLNAEGVGEQLRADVAKRLQDYVGNANLFFERDVLDQHYTYSFLRGIEELLRGNKTDVSNINWDNLISLCIAIKKSGEAQPFDREKRERNSFDAWLAGWDAVHSAVANVIQELLREGNNSANIDFPKYREQIFGIIAYFLNYPDPEPKDEKIETAMMKTKSPNSDEYLVSDPFTMAINTVRGKAFQAFAMFIYQDGKKFAKGEKIQLSSDVEELYKEVLKREETRALMFMLGHYLPSFYFRDKEWIQKLLPQIFPTEAGKKDLYLAAWEGYLTTNLYQEMFVAFQDLYSRAIALNAENYTKRQYFKNLDEALAIHLALAFIHFDKFDTNSELFKEFWAKANTKRHKEFISFIGRHSISRESADIWIKENKVDVEKLKKFWDWALENCDIDALTGFGFWINTERNKLLGIKWLAQHVHQTLEKTKGYVEWEYGLMRSLVDFAKEAPEDTLAILCAHLLEEVAKHEPIRTWLHMDSEVYDVFRELYKNKATKEGVRALINDLLPYRNGLFWGLKSVLDEESAREQKIT